MIPHTSQLAPLTKDWLPPQTTPIDPKPPDPHCLLGRMGVRLANNPVTSRSVLHLENDYSSSFLLPMTILSMETWVKRRMPPLWPQLEHPLYETRNTSSNDKSDLWRIHLALFLVKRTELNKWQKVIILAAMSLITAEYFEVRPSRPVWKEKVGCPCLRVFNRTYWVFDFLVL